MILPFVETWIQVKDGDRQAAALYRRHYSCYQFRDGRRDRKGYRNRNLICGPGEKLVLLTPDGRALFVWRRFKDQSGQQGVNCAVFRNEGTQRSSELILAAEEFARERWPGQRFYTYVKPTALPRGKRPGWCFEMAGWHRRGVTAKGLLIMEKQCLPTL